MVSRTVGLALPTVVARKLAADTFSALSDAEYQTLLVRVMREGRHRKELDLKRLVRAFDKAFGTEAEKEDRCFCAPFQ